MFHSTQTAGFKYSLLPFSAASAHQALSFMHRALILLFLLKTFAPNLAFQPKTVTEDLPCTLNYQPFTHSLLTPSWSDSSTLCVLAIHYEFIFALPHVFGLQTDPVCLLGRG